LCRRLMCSGIGKLCLHALAPDLDRLSPNPSPTHWYVPAVT
jgi:hypothetical protein